MKQNMNPFPVYKVFDIFLGPCHDGFPPELVMLAKPLFFPETDEEAVLDTMHRSDWSFLFDQATKIDKNICIKRRQ